MDGGPWWAAVRGVAKSRTQLSDFTFTFHFHALEEELATHSRVLAWRIPGMGEPGGLPSMGSHRVGHDWSDLAASSLDFFLSFFPHGSGYYDILVQGWTEVWKLTFLHVLHLKGKATLHFLWKEEFARPRDQGWEENFKAYPIALFEKCIHTVNRY